MISEIPLKVVVMSDRNATVASVINPQTGQVLATGSAKRAPGDPYNEQVGVQLAAGRALANYGEDVELSAL